MVISGGVHTIAASRQKGLVVEPGVTFSEEIGFWDRTIWTISGSKNRSRSLWGIEGNSRGQNALGTLQPQKKTWRFGCTHNPRLLNIIRLSDYH